MEAACPGAFKTQSSAFRKARGSAWEGNVFRDPQDGKDKTAELCKEYRTNKACAAKVDSIRAAKGMYNACTKCNTPKARECVKRAGRCLVGAAKDAAGNLCTSFKVAICQSFVHCAQEALATCEGYVGAQPPPLGSHPSVDP